MFTVLHILTVLVVAVAMALALAHALELPGKLRLDQKTYAAVQPIYYPGFTFGGVSEPVGLLLALTLLLLSSPGSGEFWLSLVATVGLSGMQGVYWLVTHPVNSFWLEGESLDRFSSDFFSFGLVRNRSERSSRPLEWTALRNRWEFSHVTRAVLGLLSLTALVIALA